MVKRLSISGFLSVENAIIIDVRTPSEYAKGHIPLAENLPLFTDEERAEVGTLYVRKSREAAVERGLEFVGPRMATIVKRAREMSQGRQILLYCWRGGMRSGSVQWLLETAGLPAVQLIGGYKAYRAEFDRVLQKPWQFRILSGPTGSGKTEILKSMAANGHQVIDLEGLANHKGSVFGALGQEQQPTTEEFINLLHDIFRHLDPAKPVWVEGESITIGHVFIPPLLFDLLQRAPIVNMEIPREKRLQRIVDEYGDFSVEQLQQAFTRIQKRLGYDNYKLAIEALEIGDIKKAADIALVYYDKGYLSSQNKRKPLNSITISSETDDPYINSLKIIELCK